MGWVSGSASDAVQRVAEIRLYLDNFKLQLRLTERGIRQAESGIAEGERHGNSPSAESFRAKLDGLVAYRLVIAELIATMEAEARDLTRSVLVRGLTRKRAEEAWERCAPNGRKHRLTGHAPQHAQPNTHTRTRTLEHAPPSLPHPGTRSSA